MRAWAEVAFRGPDAPRPGGRITRLAVPLLVSALLLTTGHRLAAVAVVSAALLLTALAVIHAPAAERVDRAMVRLGRVVGQGLRVVLLGAVALVVLLPAALITRVLGCDPLGRSVGWVSRTSVPGTETRLYGVEPARRAVRPSVGRATVALRVVGAVFAVLLLNYGVGWTWEARYGSHDTPTQVTARGLTELAASPAMASDDWAAGYWREFEALRYEFEPYLLSRVAPVAGRHIHVEGAVRRSYRPVGAPADVPVVWFLGGSALWGVGQRDDHTIPSEVARLAERDGRPIEVVNLGQPGYTSWQAMLLLEQQLAVRPAPDLVVMYDGAADVEVQLDRASEIPTHFNVAGVNTDLVGRDSAREQLEEWWQAYQETSLVHRLADQIKGLFAAAPADAAMPGLVDRVVDLHARSVDLAAFVADEHDVPIVFAWQAARGVDGDGGAYRAVAATEVPGAALVDLSGALDDEAEAVFLDGVLTNEAGGRVVAGHLWAQAQPYLASLDR